MILTLFVALSPAMLTQGIQTDSGPSYNYCESTVGSGGEYASISCSGFYDLENVLEPFALTVKGVPAAPSGFGMFTYGQVQANIPFGNGTLCISPFAPGINRMPLQSLEGGGSTCSMAEHPEYFALIEPGSSWNFQFWYRDPAAGGANFNLSDALHVDFAPSANDGLGSAETRIGKGLEASSGSGQGTLQLPGWAAEGLLTGVLVTEGGGPLYGLDATLTIWLPSGGPFGFPRGGIQGQIFEANQESAGTQLQVEGEWFMTSDQAGIIKASLFVDSESGERSHVGTISGKLHTDGADRDSHLEDRQLAGFGAKGSFGVEFALEL